MSSTKTKPTERDYLNGDYAWLGKAIFEGNDWEIMRTTERMSKAAKKRLADEDARVDANARGAGVPEREIKKMRRFN